MANSKIIARYTHIGDPAIRHNVVREGNKYAVFFVGGKDLSIRIGEPSASQGDAMKLARQVSGLG